MIANFFLNFFNPGSGGGPGSDTTAIHDDQSSEINAIASKAAPIAADLVVIEDSAAAFAKKKVSLGTLPGGGGGGASNVFVFEPGIGATTGNRYKTWAEIKTAHEAVKGTKFIVLSNTDRAVGTNFIMGAVANALSGVIFVLESGASDFPPNVAKLVLPIDCTWTSLPAGFDGITIDVAIDAPLKSLGNADGFQTIWFRNGCQIDMTNATSTMFDVVATETGKLTIFASDFTTIIGGGVRKIFNAGIEAAVMAFFCYNGSEMKTDMLFKTSNASSFLIVQYEDSVAANIDLTFAGVTAGTKLIDPKGTKWTAGETLTAQKDADDGDRIIRRKVVQFGNLAGAGINSMSQGHGITGLRKVIGISGKLEDGSGNFYSLPYYDLVPTNSFAIKVTSTTVIIESVAATDNSAWSADVLLEYTVD